MAFCSNCGKEVSDNVKFCSWCGNELKVDEIRALSTSNESADTSQQPEQNNVNMKNKVAKRSKNEVLCIIGGILFATVACVVIFLQKVVGIGLFIASAVLIALPAIFQIKKDLKAPKEPKTPTQKKQARTKFALIVLALLIGVGYVVIDTNSRLKPISKCSTPVDTPLDTSSQGYSASNVTAKLKGSTCYIKGTAHNNNDMRAIIWAYVEFYDERGVRKDIMKYRIGEVPGNGKIDFSCKFDPSSADKIIYYNITLAT